MKPLAVGILAHVDAGKTTLSEAVLYQCGVIRKLGRVDRKDAFLIRTVRNAEGESPFFQAGKAFYGRI